VHVPTLPGSVTVSHGIQRLNGSADLLRNCHHSKNLTASRCLQSSTHLSTGSAAALAPGSPCNAAAAIALQDLAIVLAWAGHDTSSSALSRALHLLAGSPGVLARLRAEQQEVVAQHGQSITEAVLRQCTYLDAVVREVLRLHVSGGLVLCLAAAAVHTGCL
jgi:hypothetical protein